MGQEFNLLTEWIMTGEEPKTLDECHAASEELLTGYIADWIREQKEKDQNFSQNFQTDCALSFPEFADWLKKRKTSRGPKN